MADAPPVDLVPPPPPPSPPLSPLPATSGVKINVTEYAWNVVSGRLYVLPCVRLLRGELGNLPDRIGTACVQ